MGEGERDQLVVMTPVGDLKLGPLGERTAVLASGTGRVLLLVAERCIADNEHDIWGMRSV